MNVFELQKGYFRVYDGKTAYSLFVDSNHDFSRLPEPEEIYQWCRRRQLSGEQTINLMLKTLHRRRVFKGGYLGKLPLCIMLIGPRGSGKSAGAAGIAVLDGLLAGRRVVSNMPIALVVRYKDAEKLFYSEDLDAALMLDVNEFAQNYFDCMMVVDETNVAIADALRSTSNQSLNWAFILQQMRKRHLDFVLTSQNEDWGTNRTRFQIDFYVSCRDQEMLRDGKPRENHLGRKSRWQLYDMSGLVTGEVLKTDNRGFRVPPYTERVFWNVPFWNCYQTELLQRKEKILPRQAEREKLGLDATRLEKLAVEYDAPIRLVTKSINLGLERVLKADLWAMLGIADNRPQIIKVGSILNKIGCETITGTEGRMYIFPSQAEMVKNLSNMGLNVSLKEDEIGDG